MKNIIVLVAFLFTSIAFAQNRKPVFEKKGEVIKGTYFHENGKVSQTGFYKDGKLHGAWISYNSEGKKVSTGNYKAGKKTGKWFFYDGNKLSEVNYNNNAISSVKAWDDKSDVAINFNK